MNENAVHVAVDVGYGYVKVLSENKRFTFPTLIGTGMKNNLGGLFNKENNINNIHIESEGNNYFVGELAKESNSPSRIFEQNRYEHDYFKLIINIAIQLVTNGESKDIYLSTGLPLSYYSTQAKKAKQSLLGLQPEITWHTGELSGKTIQNNIKDVIVFPQGASAIQTAIRDRKGKIIDNELMMPGSLIGLIDIGYRTTDFIVVDIKEDKSFMPRPSLSDTIEIGVHSLMQEVERHFKKITNGSDLSEYNLSRILNYGFITYIGEKIDFRDFIEEHKKTLASNINDRLKKHWSDEFSFYNAIYLAGGGGIMFEEALQPHFYNMLEVINESQFANAIGYYRWGNDYFKRKQV